MTYRDRMVFQYDLWQTMEPLVWPLLNDLHFLLHVSEIGHRRRIAASLYKVAAVQNS